MWWRKYLLVICIVVLVSDPAIAETLTMSADPEWVVANGQDSTIVRLEVVNFNSDPVAGATVSFSVDNPLLGFVYPVSGIVTDANGLAQTTFRSKTISGTANVTATVTSPNGTFIETTPVKIDHDTPYSIRYLSHPTEQTVGTVQNIMVGLQDTWGNIVDDRRYAEEIDFTIITLNDQSRLWNYSASNFSNISTTHLVGSDGLAYANITLGTVPGDTLVRIDPPITVRDKTITITRVANGTPYSMTVKRDPSVPYVPADNESNFVFTYILYDEYGNGLNNKQIKLESDSGPIWGPLLVTTVSGMASESYGPFYNATTGQPEIFSATVTAYAMENLSVNKTLTVEFYDPSPTTLLLTISPVTMPSLDVPEASYAMVTAAVVDRYGKPVGGETVTFSMGTPSYPSTYNITAAPYLENLSAITDSNGYASVHFYPGAFTRDYNDTLFDDSATGSVDIQAQWSGQTDTVNAIWKNYPYLSVATSVDKYSMDVNETVNVSITVKGDGFALLPKPIDLILCTNRGSSMLSDMYWQEDPAVWEDKMVYLHQAAPFLLSYLNQTYRDRGGIVSYGVAELEEYPDSIPGKDNKKDDDEGYISSNYDPTTHAYDDWATVDHILDLNIPAVSQDSQTINPFGTKKNQNHVPMRYGLYKSINELTCGPGADSQCRAKAIKAIVLLADAEWNDYGDPSAGWDGTQVKTSLGYYEAEKSPTSFPESGVSQWTAFTNFDDDTNVAKEDTRQNLGIYAAQHDIYIFPVAYFQKGTNVPSSIDKVFTQLASTTGGTYYRADSGENLREIFEEIGRKLRNEAGVNTTASLNFSQVKLNNITVPGNQAFDYVYQDGLSTMEHKWNASADIIPEHYFNQTPDWEDDQMLNFDLGTMYLGDWWTARFTLIAKEAGTVEFFGNGSSIRFNEGEEITIPGLFEYSRPIRFGDVPTSELWIDSFSVDDNFNSAYKVVYTGEKVVHVKLSYRKIEEGIPYITVPWKQYAAVNYQCVGGICGSIQDEQKLNKWLLTPGTYQFRCEAWASDTPKDEEIRSNILLKKKFFIWLR
jgi:hypothetical protein